MDWFGIKADFASLLFYNLCSNVDVLAENIILGITRTGMATRPVHSQLCAKSHAVLKATEGQ